MTDLTPPPGADSALDPVPVRVPDPFGPLRERIDTALDLLTEVKIRPGPYATQAGSRRINRLNHALGQARNALGQARQLCER